MKMKLAVIPGDGIGPEVAGEAVKTAKKVCDMYGHRAIFTEAPAGGNAIDRYGEPLPKKTLDLCKSCDSVILGAVGGWQWDSLPGDMRPERALLGLRGELGLYANLRPAVLHEALKGACPLRKEIADAGINIMVVRELTGGMYFGDRGRKDTPLGQAAWDTELYSVFEVKRIAEAAFDAAKKRGRRVTNVDKANVLESSRLWREVVAEAAKGHPEISLDHMYVDNASMQLIRDPGHFDVIVTTNMFGDILSDEASQLTGSIGMLPSASLGGSGFGMYEPIHGSAPDLAGKDVANPIAAILSIAMLFRYSFSLEEEAASIESAVTRILNQGFRTGDIYSEGMKRVGTKEMGRLINESIGRS
ncbi:MAG: 3-isopropylmalate dehydrogenase [Clostridiales bacterium]|jgi:3-isopropylmalate dehydrogenase|nr:3-isopropylmalate dehydrogenase [Clostridiales bacterium]